MLTTLKKYPRLAAALTVVVALAFIPALFWPEVPPKINGALSSTGCCYALAAVIFLLIVPAMWWYDSEMLKYPEKNLPGVGQQKKKKIAMKRKICP